MNAEETYKLLEKMVCEETMELLIPLANIKELNESKNIELDFHKFTNLEKLIFVFNSDLLNLNSIKIKNTPKIVTKLTNKEQTNKISFFIESNKTTYFDWSNGNIKKINIQCPNIYAIRLHKNYLTDFELKKCQVRLVMLDYNPDLGNIKIDSKEGVKLELSGNKKVKDLHINKIQELYAEKGLLFTKINNVYEYLDSVGQYPVLVQESQLIRELF